MSEDAAAPVTSPDDLVAFLREGETPRAAWRVGTEHEKIGLRARDLSPVPYEGEDGIGAVLNALAQSETRGGDGGGAGDGDDGAADDDGAVAGDGGDDAVGGRAVAAHGWNPVREGANVIALAKPDASVTLEPGGQLELSGAPLRTTHETCDELQRHLALLRRVSEPLGLLWLSLGANPLHDVETQPRMPKARYEIMRAYLPARARLPLEMMHLTATVQANFDFEDEADMAEKMRMAMGVTPIVSALFANSPFARGAPSGFVSRRLHIWQHTDPDRCGILPFVFEDGFGYQRWVEWAAAVPMFFIVRAGRYHPTPGLTFARFMERGFEGFTATRADFDLHLTTLFPEVRCKQFIEVRGADAVSPALLCALPALWKGLFYNDGARGAATELVARWPLAERLGAQDAVARAGLRAKLASHSALDWARELHDIARAGLASPAAATAGDADERGFLDPLAEMLERGASPGEQLLARWENEWRGDVRALIKAARY